jgi:hypothetical protein
MTNMMAQMQDEMTRSWQKLLWQKLLRKDSQPRASNYPLR